jgi:hypothetical protein
MPAVLVDVRGLGKVHGEYRLFLNEHHGGSEVVDDKKMEEEENRFCLVKCLTHVGQYRWDHVGRLHCLIDGQGRSLINQRFLIFVVFSCIMHHKPAYALSVQPVHHSADPSTAAPVARRPTTAPQPHHLLKNKNNKNQRSTTSILFSLR